MILLKFIWLKRVQSTVLPMAKRICRRELNFTNEEVLRKVLLVNLPGLGAEVAKNLVLSGIYSLTLLDSNEVQEEDLNYNFLIKKTSLNKNVRF